MAWNNVGSFLLSAGASITITYSFSGGADFGAQHAMAHPILIATVLTVSNQGKERMSGGAIRYRVTVTNVSPRPASFSLQGGGFV